MTWKLYEVQISISLVKICWNTATLNSLHIASGCFYSTMAELRSYNRNMPTTPDIFTIWPFAENVCQYSWITRLTIAKMPIRPKLMYWFNAIPVRTQLALQELTIWSYNPWKCKEHRQPNYLEKNKVGGLTKFEIVIQNYTELWRIVYRPME